MRIRITDHAKHRAQERLGWDEAQTEDRIRAFSLKAADLAPISGIEEMRLKVDGVVFVCRISPGRVNVVTVIG